ncbi:MAG: hypothetical protein PHR61_01945 [Candidatus Absconditabacteria bacterium]|nr:hypothetical protein [Candidatus Absconditabacteria bacterium]
MENKIAIIREKLTICGQTFVQKDFLTKILDKFAPNYSIEDLCTKGLLTPIKRDKRYINNKSRSFVNPFVVGALYMGDDTYMFGGLSIYNRYGFSEQVAERYTIYNTKYSGKKIIGPCKFIFVRQRESFFYGGIEQKVDKYLYKVMSKERVFIQFIKENKKFDTLPSTINKKQLQTLAKKYVSKNLYTKISALCL